MIPAVCVCATCGREYTLAALRELPPCEPPPGARDAFVEGTRFDVHLCPCGETVGILLDESETS